jgi:hypothetical protein
MVSDRIKSWSASLVILAIIAAVAVVSAFSGGLPYWVASDSNYRQVKARITYLGPADSETQAGQVRIGATISDGSRGTTIVPQAQVFGCRVGDPIPARQNGIHLHLLPAPCNRASSRAAP